MLDKTKEIAMPKPDRTKYRVDTERLDKIVKQLREWYLDQFQALCKHQYRQPQTQAQGLTAENIVRAPQMARATAPPPDGTLFGLEDPKMPMLIAPVACAADDLSDASKKIKDAQG